MVIFGLFIRERQCVSVALTHVCLSCLLCECIMRDYNNPSLDVDVIFLALRLSLCLSFCMKVSDESSSYLF